MTTTPAPGSGGLFARLGEKLASTRRALADGLGQLLRGQRKLDDALLDELEVALLSADLGIDTTQALLADISNQVARHQLSDGDAVYEALRQRLVALLTPSAKPIPIATGPRPFVILVVGVNGAGKTTTIGKLARHFKASGRQVMLAAGDTFRAAAVEQLQRWGERNDVPVIAQASGADSAAVAHDAVQAAIARKTDVLLIDTAGRLHTQGGLMDELRKIRRVIARVAPEAPHEVLLVLDGSTGQNALVQLEQFHAAVGVTGLVLTKLDGTAKGGVVFAMAQRTGVPIRYIGVGESIEDLRPFDAQDFVNAILPAGDAP
jgi:fused signal recognition particle receptor